MNRLEQISACLICKFQKARISIEDLKIIIKPSYMSKGIYIGRGKVERLLLGNCLIKLISSAICSRAFSDKKYICAIKNLMINFIKRVANKFGIRGALSCLHYCN